jgi:hypothetical protein
MKELITLIGLFIEPSKHYHRMSSYALKSMFEHLTGCYISEDTFINAMLFVGVERKKVGHHYIYKIKVKPNQPNVDRCFWGSGNELKYLQ